MGRRTERQDPGGPPRAPASLGAPLLAGRARRGAAAVLVGCAAVTALLGLLFYRQHAPGAFDSAVDNWIGSALSGHAHAAELIVLPGRTAGVAAMTLALVAACLVTRRLRGALLAAVAVPAAGGLAELVIKPLVGRTYGLGSLTFPSGHATGVFTVAAVAAVLLLGPQYPQVPARLRILLVLASYAACAVVSVAVVGLDFHYFTDTVAGGTTGTAVVLATAFVLDLPLLQRLVPAWLAGPQPGRGAGDPGAGNQDPAQEPAGPASQVGAAADRPD